MKVDKLIASAVVSAILALEAWTLNAVIDLKVQVAQQHTELLAINSRLAIKPVATQADKLSADPRTKPWGVTPAIAIK